jgi:DNA-binding MarR family transcriptional regulator
VSELADSDYERLLAFRSELRRFLEWSEHAAAEVGLTASLHQLLLAIRGHTGTEPPTVGDVALALRVRHHSAVELAQRGEAAGLLLRERDSADHRRVRLRLTELGSRRLEELTREHLPRIGALAAALEAAVRRR